MVSWGMVLACVVAWIGFSLVGTAVFYLVLPYISAEGCED